MLGCAKAGNNGIANTGDEAVEDSDAPDENSLGPGFTTDGTALAGQGIEVDLPLLHRIHELEAELSRNQRHRYDYGFFFLGLQLKSKLKTETSWCTPRNTIAFGENGGDGFHFSFLVTDNRIDANSPVVGSAPDFSADLPLANVILATNFENFLRLGLTRGYFGMYLFVHDPATAVAAYGSPDWQPSNSSHLAAGLDVDDRKKEITRQIMTRLNMTPLTYSDSEFQAIQDEFKPLLKFK
jgi:hypothetical protein